MTNSIFQQIRVACADVARTARWVAVDYGRIEAYGIITRDDELPLAHTEEHHLLHRGEDTLAYFLILDTINFGSGYFPYLDKDSGVSGYFTIARRLKDWMLGRGVPSAHDLANMSPAVCAEVFGQQPDNPHAAELLELFATAWNDLGRWLIEEYSGDLIGPFRDSESAAELVDALTQMPYYRDVAVYRGARVPILKRAQILVQDVLIAEPNHALTQFGDRNDLTIFADNVVAYVLRAEGILRYHPWLHERIQGGELIASGSTEEVEIRACSIHAIESLHNILGGSSHLTIRELDFHLWNRGQQLKKQIPDLRHRTRCVYY